MGSGDDVALLEQEPQGHHASHRETCRVNALGVYGRGGRGDQTREKGNVWSVESFFTPFGGCFGVDGFPLRSGNAPLSVRALRPDDDEKFFVRQALPSRQGHGMGGAATSTVQVNHQRVGGTFNDTAGGVRVPAPYAGARLDARARVRSTRHAPVACVCTRFPLVSTGLVSSVVLIIGAVAGAGVGG